VKAKSPVKALTGHLPPNLLESRQLETGLCTARSLLPANQPNLLFTVCNVRDVPSHLKRGERLGVTEEVTVEIHQLNQEATLNRQQQVEHLIKQIVANLPQEFTDAERHEVFSILLRNEACFSLNEFDIGYIDLVEHTINTGTHAPIRETLRRQPLPYQQAIDNHVHKMLQAGVIEPSNSSWASNVCLVKNKTELYVLLWTTDN
jgi:hypothetical protein